MLHVLGCGLCLLGGGRRKAREALQCQCATLPGQPFAEAAVRAQPPGTMRVKHNPLLGCGVVGGSSHSPRASKCLCLHLQAWLLLQIMEKKSTHLYVLRSDTSGLVGDSESSREGAWDRGK